MFRKKMFNTVDELLVNFKGEEQEKAQSAKSAELLKRQNQQRPDQRDQRGQPRPQPSSSAVTHRKFIFLFSNI